MKSVMRHDFGITPEVRPPRSVFSHRHGHKTAFNSGLLVPIYRGEVLPGDTFNVRATLLARLQTLKYPIMDNIFLDTFWFFVPQRLLWKHWEQFQGSRDTIAEIENPTDYVMPVLGYLEESTPTAGTYVTEESLSDYLGLPIGQGDVSKEDMPWIRACWHRAYYKIYNSWFRDENMIDPVTEDVGDGPDVTDYQLQRRGKRKDYFTSLLPWPQKGPAIELPLGSTAPVLPATLNGHPQSIGLYDGTNEFGLIHEQTTGAIIASTAAYNVNQGAAASGSALSNYNKAIGLRVNPSESGLIADLSLATAATINSIREAFQLQKLLERDARGGTRYVEMLKAHFGVTSPDFRLQRPELLHVSSARINVHQVEQTSESTTGNPIGKLGAFGYCLDQGVQFSKGFVEHGVILGIASVRADLTYQQGIPRCFLRSTRYDFYMPVLAGLGEQEITKKEIFWEGSSDDDDIFGYGPRWDEYRSHLSQITGKMRSTVATGSLQNWHLSQVFDSSVELVQDFIEENPPISRVIFATTEPEVIFDSLLDVKVARVMPLYGIPGMVDHF